MSIIRAGTTTTTALTSIGNTDGTIQLQVNGTTPSVTLNTLGAVGVGASPNFGTSGQALVSAGATAAPTWANVTTSPAGTTGQVQINNAGAFGAVGSGTAGQVLTSAGAGAAPTFATPAGGAWTFLQTLTASSSSTLDYSGFTGDYDVYAVTLSSLLPSGNGRTLRCNPRYAGNDTETNNLNASLFLENGGQGFSSGSSGSNASIGYSGSSGSARGVSGIVYFANPAQSAGAMVYWYHTASTSPTPAIGQFYVGGVTSGRTGAAVGFQLSFASANITSGTVRIYGIKNS